MSTSPQPKLARLRTRWSAIGAAVAITLGGGGLGMAQAAVGTSAKPVTISVAPERILDTRDDIGLAGAFVDSTPRDLQVTGTVPVAPTGTEMVVPAGAVGVLVNVTVVTPSDNGFLSLRPGGATGEPETSTVNFLAGAIEPNAATVDLSPDGKMQIWLETASNPAGTADVIVDVVGYTVDHDHDDRYYTESEVDAALGDKVDETEFDDTVTVLGEQIGDSSGVRYGTATVGIDLDPAEDDVVLALPFTAPKDGFVIVNANVNALAAANVAWTCWLNIDSTDVLRDHSIQYSSGSVAEWNDTQGFAVSAGDRTVNLVCNQDTGTAGEVTVQRRNVSVVFSPSSMG